MYPITVYPSIVINVKILILITPVLFCQEFSVEEKGVTRAASYGFVQEVEKGKEFCDINVQDFNG